VISYPSEVGGIRTRVIEAGVGDRNMLLIHGLGARADRWSRNIQPLADSGHHVYAIDLPGHGFAAKGRDIEHSVPAFADFAHTFLCSVGTSKAVVVGTSLGGHAAAWLACEHPEVVECLVLVATTGIVPLGEERRRATQSRIGDASTDGVRRKLSIVIHDPTLVTEDWVVEEAKINSSPGAAESFERLGQYFAAELDNDVVGPKLAQLISDGAFPVCVVWGAQDLGFPLTMGEAVHQTLPGSSFAVIDATSHAPYFERPDAFNHVITSFAAGDLGSEQLPGVDYRLG